MTTSDERLIAIHEAGHAIVAREHGLDFDAFLFPDDPDTVDSGAVSAAFDTLDPGTMPRPRSPAYWPRRWLPTMTSAPPCAGWPTR